MASNDEQLLAAAFETAFSPPSGIRTVVVGSESTATPSASTSETQPSYSQTTDADEGTDNYRREYEDLVNGWRAEYAIKRQKAAEERARWEAIRAAENEDYKRTGQRTIRDSWEQLDDSPIAGPPNHRLLGTSTSPSPADVRDRVTNEPEGGKGRDILQTTLPPAQSSVPATISNLAESRQFDSQKWEEIPSLESSYPSLSYPSNADTPSPHSPEEQTSEEVPKMAPAPTSATLSVFDSSLTAQTRGLALLSSLTINFVLPFINGVMLGFGEIFAKNVLAHFGWTVPGFSVATVGLGLFRRKEKGV